ncbi:MAG TPA: SRPBCC family protein [Kribbella sp.]
MKLEHKFVVPAPVEQTWAAFNDLERVVPCFPGATLTAYEGDEFTGSCKVKLGPVSLQYSGTGTFVERDEAQHHAVIEAKGKDRRGNGTATARVTARLSGTAGGETEVSVDTDLTITGRPAQFGRGLIQDVSNKLLDQFTTCLKTKLDHPTTTQPDTAARTPSQQTDADKTGAGTSGAPTGVGEGEAGATGAGAGAGEAGPLATDAGAAVAGASGAATGAAEDEAGEGGAGERGAGEGVAGERGVGVTEAVATGAGKAGPGVNGAEGDRSRASGAAGAEGGGSSAAGSRREGDAAEADAVVLDLGRTVLPMVAKRAAPYLIGAVLALVLRRLFRR